MSRPESWSELGAFLKARRAELSPEQVGLPDGPGHRRVRGLRREEVALLAAISTDYYMRIEQGRIKASCAVLAELAKALRLNDDQSAYLYELATKDAGPRSRRPARQQVSLPLWRMLDDMPTSPAFVIGRRTEILAWNELAAAVFTDFATIPEKDRSYIKVLFTDPAMRTLYMDWEEVARLAINQLRMHSARYPDDPQLAATVGELSVKDAQFPTWWAARQVNVRSSGTKRLRHPVVGELVLDWSALTCANDPDQQIIVWTAEPASPTHDALRMLAAWNATSQESQDTAR
ncbi:helix-turn-helix domain-containing protein [Kutzneria buriramensis]|uniref:Helix-turn-helix protein n=1 Tax=Kutzneria buriramensis TaxID=1045776 RepID=A0A3E0G5I1_9PSEU|nr:helix-turn-helix transcriptional regulator [Kutzneria buriramensis]REH17838.1 helix-turn-helix protein [Kutzneria buriramensis]